MTLTIGQEAGEASSLFVMAVEMALVLQSIGIITFAVAEESAKAVGAYAEVAAGVGVAIWAAVMNEAAYLESDPDDAQVLKKSHAVALLANLAGAEVEG